MDKELLKGFLLSFLSVIIAGWSLYDRDRESLRLLKIDKYWRPLKAGELESARLAKIKRRMVIGYSIIFCVGFSALAFYIFEILRSLNGF
jgi:hypothetical protein